MKELLRGILYLIASVVILTQLTGCASLRKKFIRKKKVTKETPHYSRIREYDNVPTMELYTKHYIFWKSWHREIMELLGQNSKKDKRCIDEMIGNLEDMKAMLVDEKGDQLDGHIQVLRDIKRDIVGGALTHFTRVRVRRTLEKEFTLIKINFTYRKMEPFIRAEYRRRTGAEGGDENDA